MANRPVFVPRPAGHQLVDEVSVSFKWNPGLAPSQKKKNVAAIHAAAAHQGLEPLLEVSTKSDDKLGRTLSAFNLRVAYKDSTIPLECGFQGSKVFEAGGPFTDLYSAEVRDAKRDPRLRESGKLVAFRFDRITFPIVPKTAFYDWLFLQAIKDMPGSLRGLHRFAGFTDIEFNPKRSINCQARSCATLVALEELGLFWQCLESPGRFIRLLADPPAEEQVALL